MSSELTHQAAQAQHQLLSISTVYISPLTCRWQCLKRPLVLAPNFHAARCSPQAAGNLNISNYTILDTFKLHARRIWVFTVRPDVFHLLSVVNSSITKFLSKAWTWFSTSNRLKTLHTRSLNHRHLLGCRRNASPAPALSWVITLVRYGNIMLWIAWGRTYNTIPTTCSRSVNNTNIAIVGSRRRVWIRTMIKFWRKKTPLCVSQPSKTEMASRSLQLTFQTIGLLGSGNYTLSRKWDGMANTNTFSNAGVQTSSKG